MSSPNGGLHTADGRTVFATSRGPWAFVMHARTAPDDDTASRLATTWSTSINASGLG